MIALTELGFAQRSRRGRLKEPSQGSCLIALTELGFAQRSRRGRLKEPSQGSCLIALTELGFAQRSRRGRLKEPSQGSCLIALTELGFAQRSGRGTQSRNVGANRDGRLDRNDDDPARVAATPAGRRRRDDSLGRCRRRRRGRGGLGYGARLGATVSARRCRLVSPVVRDAIVRGQRAAAVDTPVAAGGCRGRTRAVRGVTATRKLAAQAARLRARRGGISPGLRELAAQARHLLGSRRRAIDVVARFVSRQQLPVDLPDRDEQVRIVRERVLEEQRPQLGLRHLALLVDALGFGEHARDGGAAARLSTPLPHRLVHQIGVGLLVRVVVARGHGRPLGSGRRELRHQLASLRFFSGGARTTAVRARRQGRPHHETNQQNRRTHFEPPTTTRASYLPLLAPQGESRQAHQIIF